MGLLSGERTTKKIYYCNLLRTGGIGQATGEIELSFVHSRYQFTNLCEVYKILNDYCKTEVNNCFTFSNRWMHGHSSQINETALKTVAKSDSFALRVIDK